ncbi:MAG: anaerobic ribonucleoside-triphosphate reductase activating protein [Ruminococcaceae bacterium]|nr:anaerobic ribonucleoside-triphosphate reductase activating protein [Oscillospiraceae bacterium]
MIIGGFQKMTMLDYPGKIACTIFTYGCNFKCPFCHNRRLVLEEATPFTEEEILSYLNKRRGVLDGVCISGGEPMLQGDLFDFIKKVKDLGLLVKLDTNGYFPEKLKHAIDNGLVDYVAMDIKNCREKYGLTAGNDKIDISNIEKSVEILKQGRVDYEFRTTVTKELHTPADFVKIGEWLCGAKRYYIQNFVDSGNLIENTSSPLDLQGLNALLNAVLPYVESSSLRGV